MLGSQTIECHPLTKYVGDVTPTHHINATDYCGVTGVDTLLYHRCRAANPVGQYFYVNVCPVGQVMNVQSAELGYSVAYNLSTNPPHCPGNDCTRPTDVPATECNGRRACFISQSILLFSQGSALCSLSNDGNFIRIRYTCVSGRTFSTFSIVFGVMLHIYTVSQKSRSPCLS